MSVRRFAFHYDYLDATENVRRVFSDPSHLRRKRLLRNFAFLTFFILFWIFVFFFNVDPIGKGGALKSSLLPAGTAISNTYPTSVGSHIHEASSSLGHVSCGPDDPAFAAMAEGGGFNRLVAHVPTSIEWSHLSLRKSCDALDVLVTDWITVSEDTDGFRVQSASSDTRMPVDQFIKDAKAALEVMPRIVLDFRPLDTKLADKFSRSHTRAKLLSDIKSALIEIGASGGCIAYGSFTRDTNAGVLRFLEAFQATLAGAGLRSCIIVQGTDDSWIDKQITRNYDEVILKLFNEPWVGSAPAPLSTNSWFANTAHQALEEVGPDRLTVAIGNFATDWKSGVPLPKTRSYGEVMSMVAEADAELSFNQPSSGSFASFRSNDGKMHKIWLQDVASAYNQLSELRQLGVSNVAIWSLGLEDPGLWPLLNAQDMQARLHDAKVTNVFLDDYVEYNGSGAAIRVLEQMKVGFRKFQVNQDDRRIEDQVYQDYPRPYVLERYAQAAPNELVLTFDDGPDTDFTPKILDILRETNTPAAFFVLGKNVVAAPGTLRRVFEEGHEIGTHSFSHPRMDKISATRTSLEHDLTHRAIASATGHDTTLYREPFLRSGGPISSHRIKSLETVQSRGSIIFGMDVVPKDWLDRSSDEIAAYVIDQVERGSGNVILLHDGGGDRSESIKALPIIINELRSKGFEFKSISEVLGIERAALMPSVKGPMPVFDRISFAFASGTSNGLTILFWVVLVIGLSRSMFILTLALLRRRHRAEPAASNPKVAVIIPAFNEAMAIHKCIESVLASDYQNLEVVVVDDGSTDFTLNEVFEFKFEKNVRIISQPNQGKWSALNRAIKSLDADIAICIDADTQVQCDTISKLTAHFADPKVGAVAGKIVVGNRVNLLTRMQALEYVSAQNFDRRAFDHINGIMVVPGAVGAWRVFAMREAGLFCQDTMTEDSDLTIAVNRAGYQVIYEDRAVAFTEAPQSIRTLLSQRLRWSLGMFQGAWKHRGAIFEGRRIGLVAIPDMLIFGYLFPLLAPIADVFAIIVAYNYLAGDWSGDVGNAATVLSPELLWAYLTLPAMEFLIAAFAVFTDRTARPGLLWLWPVHRILYRPLLYLTTFRAVLRAMTGTLANWGRTKRQGHNLLLKEAKA